MNTWGHAPKYAKLVKEARERQDVQYTWMYVMVRFVDIRGKMKTDMAGNLNAQTIINLCNTPNAVNDTFGIELEPNTNLHVLVGVQARRYQTDKLDAYLLVGFMAEDDYLDTNEVMETVKDRFIKANTPFNLDEHIMVIYDDEEKTVRLSESVIKDMEETIEVGSIDDIIN